ncbi:MAG: [Fe-Fe] hydrogenase large subunit C-terminal domain-containing protein [Bacteroidales bacterium]|nr:[Fe-Fe] hydrogenase large subunit C-terminal domain-containing protein [Bacteroidales bacterium]
MEQKFFHHALKVLENICIGCTHCMTVCPTEAIRVKNGTAHIIDNRCVDCGKCFRHCPVKAIIIDHDDFNRIFKFKHRIALVPSVIIGQFPEEITTRQIYSQLYEIGFNKVVEVEQGVEILHEAMSKYMIENPDNKPHISAFCPAIVRLIQVKFPTLVDNLIRVKPPLDITAGYLRKMLIEKGEATEDIGIFYVTPCAAKIAAIKSPVGEETSSITGVINMDLIFNKVYRSIKTGKKDHCVVPDSQPLKSRGVLWSLTHGEADEFEGRCLAIDEIHNVIEFLEKLENDEIQGVDFLELRACDQSCAGGVLASGNRFLTVERLRKRANSSEEQQNDTIPPRSESINDYHDKLLNDSSISIITPRSMLKLDEDMGEAMRKMDNVNQLMKCFPRIDCGACGTPNCQALATDIVQGNGKIEQCFYIQHLMRDRDVLDARETSRINGEIWGPDKIDTDRCFNTYLKNDD